MKTITMKDLSQHSQKLGPNEIILDVRSPEEFAEGHIPGAKNIPHNEVGAHTQELKKFNTIYIHCKMGGRAAQAAATLHQSGIQQLVCIGGGGMPDWVASGLPVEKGRK